MKRIFSILVLLIMALSLCSCGSDYHDQLPYPFSEIRSGMSKDEILTKFESLGIKKNEEPFYPELEEYVIEKCEINNMYGDMTFTFDDTGLYNASWYVHFSSLSLATENTKNIEELRLLFLEVLGEPKEGYSSEYRNDNLTWNKEEETYSIKYDEYNNGASLDVSCF